MSYISSQGKESASVSGEISHEPSVYVNGAKVSDRGMSQMTPGGAVGIFVGQAPTSRDGSGRFVEGRQWYAYDPEMFLTYCSNFDAQFAQN